MTDTTQRLDAAARARGAAFVEQNARLEGIELSPESKADTAEYVAGMITASDVVARARARFGLEPDAGRGR